MDVAPANPTLGSVLPGCVVGTESEPLYADFFKNLIGENTRMITGRIDTLSEDLIGLAR